MPTSRKKSKTPNVPRSEQVKICFKAPKGLRDEFKVIMALKDLDMSKWFRMRMRETIADSENEGEELRG